MAINKLLLLGTCIVVFNSPSLHCHTMNDTNTLLKDKLADYNKSTRPTYNQSNPTVVAFDFELIYIQEFNEVQQKLSIMAIPGLKWTDESMVWSPALYGGMNKLVTESGPFWIPNIFLGNTVGELDRIGADWQTIVFYYHGAAYYNPGEVYSSACSVDVTYYPWDIHNCFLLFYPQGQTPDEVYLTANVNKVATNYYIENGGWAFVDSRIRTRYSTYFSELLVELVFERKPRYVIVNVIMPIIFMAFLCNVVFVIPADCGERISYSITVLLATAVYLTLVGDNLPKISNPMSYFSYYLLALLVTSICIAMATIFNLRIYHNDESEPVSGCWAKITTCFKCGRRKSKAKEEKIKLHNGYVSQGSIYPIIRGKDYRRPGSNSQALKVQGPLQNTRHSDTRQVSTLGGNSDSEKSLTWKDVSVALDKIFFVVFLIILITVTIVYAAIVSTSERTKLSK